MRLFSSIRIAPGVRLSTSRRGLRAHVGPRGARLHVGGGRSGVSTGAGPFTAYQSLGGTTRSRPVPASRPATSRAGGAPSAAAQRAQAHQKLVRRLAHLDGLNREDFRQTLPPEPPRPILPKFATLLDTAEKAELRGVSPFDRTARAAARQRARARAEGWARDLLTLSDREVRAADEHRRRTHAALLANDPARVRAAVSAVIGDLSGRLVGISGAVARLTVFGPSQHEVPAYKPTWTASGAPTVARMTKTERAARSRQMTAARVIVLARRVFVVAPGLRELRIVLSGCDAVNGPVLAVTLERSSFFSSDCSGDAWSVLASMASELVCDQRARTGELQPIVVPAHYGS